MPSVIKSESPVARGGTVAFNFDDLNHQAQAYLDKVRGHAAELVAAAEQEAAAIRQRAAEQGRAEALAAAQHAAIARLEEQTRSLVPALRAAIDGIQSARHACLHEWEKRVMRLSTLIASRIVQREIARTPDLPLTFIRESLELAGGAPQVRLLLHPQDHAALAPKAALIANEITRLGPVDIVADETVSSGGCRVETRFGVIDKTLEAQLARVEAELLA